MKIKNEDEVTIISYNSTNEEGLMHKLSQYIKEHESESIVIDLLLVNELSLSDVLAFQAPLLSHREKGNSFVIVADQIDIDSVPETIVLVPTLQEAHDIIEMEMIERDLGF